MTLIALLLTLMLIGVVLWLIENYVPLSAPIRTIIRVVVVVVVILWLVQLFCGDLQLPRLR